LRTKQKNRIRWRIYNRSCASAQWVELRNFREKSDTGLGRPVSVTTDPLRTASAVAPGQTVELNVQLTLSIERASYYKYDIANAQTVDTLRVTRDPDIEMWDR
jgi:hypothetical protein